MVEKMKSAVEQAIIAADSEKAASSSSLQSRDSEKVKRMPSHNSRMWVIDAVTVVQHACVRIKRIAKG